MGRHPIAPAGKEAVTHRNRLYCRSEPAGDADLPGAARCAEHLEETERVGKIALVGQIIDIGVKLELLADFIPDARVQPRIARQGEVVGDIAGALAARQSAVWGKSVSVRVDLGGRRY